MSEVFKLRRFLPVVLLATALVACKPIVNAQTEPTSIPSWTGSYINSHGTIIEKGKGNTCPKEIVHRSIWRRPGLPWWPPQTITNTLKPGTCKVH